MACSALQKGVRANGIGEIQRGRGGGRSVNVQSFEETALSFGPLLPLGVNVSEVADGVSALEAVSGITQQPDCLLVVRLGGLQIMSVAREFTLFTQHVRPFAILTCIG